MQSIQELFIIGTGPSASHTIGPRRAAESYLAKHPEASQFEIVLYGSLAATGKGHGTDLAIEQVFCDKQCTITWKANEVLDFHPNAMDFFCVNEMGERSSKWRVYSVGGGALAEEGGNLQKKEIYSHASLESIIEYCHEEDLDFAEYVKEAESEDVDVFLTLIWKKMQASVERGLKLEGLLPGPLQVKRKSKNYYDQAKLQGNLELQKTAMVSAFALAVSEENACYGEVVTAPTCGACGVLPGVLTWFSKIQNYPDEMLLKALATAGLIGNLAKKNASISGAEVGCQGEVGVACSMAAAAACALMGGSLAQIEYAAEMAIEHHLGLTCDPVGGLVQIPCIERNAVAASRAMDCANYALLSDGQHKISFDQVIETMFKTGKDMMDSYKETAKGGLAAVYQRNLCS